MTRRKPGDGALFRRAHDGLWVGRVELGYADGKRLRATVYSKTRAGARAKLEEARRVAGQSVNPSADCQVTERSG